MATRRAPPSMATSSPRSAHTADEPSSDRGSPGCLSDAGPPTPRLPSARRSSWPSPAPAVRNGAAVADDPFKQVHPAHSLAAVPGHPNLLPAFRAPASLREWVKKPRFGREGQNVEVKTATGGERQPGQYDDEGFVYQQYFELPVYDGRRANVCSWGGDHESAGVGICLTRGPITPYE